ncbi:MAG: UDP-N-acetylmuramate--L-alanine ligase [Verrucomicrobiales bacterium]
MTFSLDDFPADQTHVHLIGVAGSGMSGLAWLFLQLGYHVSGSDKVTTTETERLQQAGLLFFCPQTAEAVRGANLVVFTSAVKDGNPAFDEARARGVPMWRRAEALAAIMRGKKSVIICGTHGKTTTSSMAAHVLREAGLKPSHYVGGEIPVLGANARWEPAGEYFVAEGDESDGTLINFHAEHAIVLNIEAEHLDYYKNLDEILTVFQRLVDQTASAIYYCADDAGARGLCQGRAKMVSFGFDESADFRAVDLASLGQSTTCTVIERGRPLGELVLNIPGRHNVSNALAVVALASERGVEFERIKSAINTFRGAKRRFEVKYRSRNFRVIDDYGHHPTEIAATLEAARGLNPGRLVVLFQPHRFSRTQLLRDQFGPAFSGCDALFVTDVYAASEPPIPGISGETILTEARKSAPGLDAFSVPEVGRAHLTVGNFLRPGDMLLTLGAGNVHEAGARLADDLRALDEMAAALDEPEATLRLYEPMRQHTTMLIGGPAQFWIEPRTISGFQRLVAHLRDQGIPIRVIGRGSNLLVRDGGIRGAVVHPARGEFADVCIEDDRLHTGVGARFQKVAMAARAAGLGGFEWMEGIPGNVGGCLRMNAGAMGSQTFDRVVSVKFINAAGELCEKTASEISAHYRNVPEFSTHYAVSAVFRGAPANGSDIEARLTESKQQRRATQPVGASAGCIFKNPGPELGAGQLIDELGLKGSAVGGARISELHGNFIINEGGATARDVLTLIDRIKAAAREKRSIQLETEVQVIGEDALM